MNGLLEQNQPQGHLPPETAPATTAAPAAGYDKQEGDLFVAHGIKLVHTAKVSDAILDQVRKSPNPIMAIADATLMVVGRIEQSAEASGKKLALGTLAYGANIIMGEIIVVAEASGMKKLDDKGKYQAYSLAVSKYIDEAIKAGKITKEEMIQFGNEAAASPEGKKIAATAEMIGGGQDVGTT